MKRTPGGYKRIIFDVLGVLIIIAGISISWLPGPGGIPLILAGLGLLSINNHWARRLTKLFEKYADSAMLLLFPKQRSFVILHDVMASILLITSVWLMAFVQTAFSIGIGISLLAIAMAEVLINHDLIKRIR